MLFVLFFFVIVVAPILAQWLVDAHYRKYAEVPVSTGVSGKEAALIILLRNGVNHVGIDRSKGEWSDAYDPNQKRLFLSEENYQGHSVANIAVAAHEASHALQDHSGFRYLRWRSTLVPVASMSGKLAFLLLLLGVIYGLPDLALLGLCAVGLLTAFQWLSLPIELNASSRAVQQLSQNHIINHSEVKAIEDVLWAAAGTYITAAVIGLLQFTFFCVCLFPMVDIYFTGA